MHNSFRRFMTIHMSLFLARVRNNHNSHNSHNNHGIELTLHLLVLDRVPNLLRLSNVTSRFGLGVCFGTGGCLHLVLPKVAALGLGAGDVAGYRVECGVGGYSLDNLVAWDFPDWLDRASTLTLGPVAVRLQMRMLILIVLVLVGLPGFLEMLGIAWWLVVLFCPWPFAVCRALRFGR